MTTITKKETTQILAILKAAYPNFYRDMTSEEAHGTVSVWSLQFKDVSADIVLMALNKLISTSKFPPTIAEVKSKFTDIFWEAYDKIHPLYYPQKNLPEDEAKLYKRIYDETEKYRYPKQGEPTITQMIELGQIKQLTGGQ